MSDGRTSITDGSDRHVGRGRIGNPDRSDGGGTFDEWLSMYLIIHNTNKNLYP
jgi:hypothetical protein